MPTPGVTVHFDWNIPHSMYGTATYECLHLFVILLHKKWEGVFWPDTTYLGSAAMFSNLNSEYQPWWGLQKEITAHWVDFE